MNAGTSVRAFSPVSTLQLGLTEQCVTRVEQRELQAARSGVQHEHADQRNPSVVGDGSPRPGPVPNLRGVLAVLDDVATVLDQRVAERVDDVCVPLGEMRNPFEDVERQMEPVQVVEYGHVEGVVVVPSSL